MRTYACELLVGTTKHRAEVDARWPAEAAQDFCEKLIETFEIEPHDGDAILISVTAPGGHNVTCRVTVSKRMKVEYAFSAVETK